MKKKNFKKVVSEIESKKLMFKDIVFKSVKDAEEHGFVPDRAIAPEDVAGCEAVVGDNFNE